METQPTKGSPVQSTGCCPPFDPGPWTDREVTWDDKPFVVDHVHSLFHVPIDMGKVVTRNLKLIEISKAESVERLMLTDESSPWGAEIYIQVTGPVAGAQMATLSGTYLTRVYEGPFRNAGEWAEDMRSYVAGTGRPLEKLYFAYTTCPACAKAYGKNYVVLFAKVPAAVAQPSLAQQATKDQGVS